MNKIWALLVAGLLAIGLSACVTTNVPPEEPPVTSGSVGTGEPSNLTPELRDSAHVSVTVPFFRPTVVIGGDHYGTITANGNLTLFGDLMFLRYPELVELGGGVYDSTLRHIVAAWIGQNAGFALDEYARLWGFGDGWWGTLGPQGTYSQSGLVLLLENAVAADAGLAHGIALTYDGTVWLWGPTGFSAHTAIAPMQIASNAIGVMMGFRGGDWAYVLARDGTLWDMGNCYDLTAGIAPAPVPVMERVRHAESGLVITEDGTLYLIESDGEPMRLMDGIATAQGFGTIQTLAVGTDGGLYFWNDAGYEGEPAEGLPPSPPVVSHTDPVRLMDGVSCAIAGMQEIYVQVEGEWNLRVISYAQVREVLAGGSLLDSATLPVLFEGIHKYTPAHETLRLSIEWDGTVTPVAPVLPEPGEPPLDAYARATVVPDFLDYEQQLLYRRALCLYLHTFGGETSAVERFPLPPGAEPDPPEGEREYIELGEMRYLPARGRYRDWTLFDAAVHSVFTDEFWARRNEWTDGIPIFTELNGKLVFIDASRGDSYYNSNFPDEFVLQEKNEDSIRFTLIGHYSEPYPKEGETYKERDARLAREFDTTVEYPIEMVCTSEGWRFARFYAAISDEDIFRWGF